MTAAGLTLPQRFGEYLVEREIGRGSMGVVYEAVHRPLERRVALKVLRTGLGMDRQGLERFRREAKAAAQLPHDHIVGVLDAGETGGEAYFTMPLLPGASLAEFLDELRATGEAPPGARAHALLDRWGLPRLETDFPELAYARRLADALAGVADALHGLHELGMLHRDIKPSNLMIGPGGRVLLADFGLVRMSGQRLTETGQILGTLLYMSPEQIVGAGGELDGRADVYSLGATLFELLTLQPPLQGRDARETIGLILKKRPRSVRSVNPALPKTIDTIVSRALEKRPEDRYATAAALRDDLAAFARGRPVRASAPRWPGRQWLRRVRLFGRSA